MKPSEGRMLSSTEEEKERLVRDDVQREGWSLIYVIDDKEVDPPFAYSVGFYETFGHPEIIIIGMTEALANPVINNMGIRIELEGIRYEGGRYYGDILEGFDCYLHAVRKEFYPAYVGWDIWYYDGDDFPLLQCVFPCDRGLFPWDPGAPTLLRKCQSVLGGRQGH